MIAELLSANVQSFVIEHEHDDVRVLLLKHDNIMGVPTQAIVQQIIGRRKAREKLPSFFSVQRIVYPPAVNIEQSSSEETARFKSISVLSGDDNHNSIADLTGGLGVDTIFLAQKFKQVHFVEPDHELLVIARHNHQQLRVTNIIYHNVTAQDFLNTVQQPFDCFYIDPSRRAKGNRKVFSFADCEPNVTLLLTQLFEASGKVLIKASPLLDIQQGIRDLRFVKRVIVLSVTNECKELLFLCERNHTEEPIIEAVNLTKNNGIQSIKFLKSEEQAASIEISKPQIYLYEPNASLLKAGAFKIIGAQFGIAKLHPNTHLYTSNILIKEFPGTVFRILGAVKPSPKNLITFFPNNQANIISRNYPLSVEDLRLKTRLKDGGDKYLIGCSGHSEKYLFVAEKVLNVG